MLNETLRRPALLAWLSLICGGLLAAAALLLDGWRGPALPDGVVAQVGTQAIARDEWLRALQSVQGDSGRRLDAAAQAAVLQHLVDEELLFQHALASGLVRDDPGLRKTVIAGLVDAATAGDPADEVDEAAARELFEREPQRFGGQARLRVSALRLPQGTPPPPVAQLRAALAGGPLPPPLRPVALPDAPLAPAQLAQLLGGSAAEALRQAAPDQVLGPLPAGADSLYLLLRERLQQSPRYEEVAGAVRAELAHRQADAALERLLQQLRRDTPVRIARDAQR